jgi:hypothetical protein
MFFDNRRKYWRSLVVCMIAAVCLGHSVAAAQEGVITIEGAQIRGDQESPTVLYLVPWQPPGVDSLKRAEGAFIGGQAIEPLERHEFRRLTSYHDRFLSLRQKEPDSGKGGR